MENKISSADAFLKNRQLPYSEEWLRCCIQWLHETGKRYSENELNNEIYHQWLISDFRDVEIPQLPDNVNSITKLTLNKTLTLQMMSIVDISKPKLQQLNNITNSNPLTRVLEEESKDRSSIPAKRMLQLCLSDGIQEIKANEYQTVPCLNLNLAPGTKIQIISPINIRRGQILLNQDNLKVLGGDIEEISVSNAVENVLSRYLGLPENANPQLINERLLNGVRSHQDTYIDVTSNSVVRDNNPVQNNSIVNSNVNKNVNVTSNYSNKKSDEEKRINEEIDMLLEAENDVFETIQLEKIKNRPTQSSTMFDSRPSTSSNVSYNTKQTDLMKCKEELNSLTIEPKSKTVTKPKDAKFEDIIDLDDDFFTSLGISQKLKEVDDNHIYMLKEVRELIEKKARRGKYKTFAKFKSIVQKMTVKDNLWQTRILIESDDADLEVNISNDVVTRMTGYTALEMQKLKKNIANKDTESIKLVMEALDNFKEQLLKLNSLMEIEYDTNDDFPCLIAIL